MSELADAGNAEALQTLAQWHEPTAAVQLAARRTSARLLRQPADAPSTTWPVTMQFNDAVTPLDALAKADPPVDVDPQELRAGTGPVISEKVLLATTLPVGPATTDSGDTAPQPGQVQSAPEPPDQAGAVSGAVGDGHPEAEAGHGTPAGDPHPTQPDPQARIAAGPPASLTAAVAEHLVAVAEGHNAPAFYRAGAVAALHSLLGQLSPDLNSRVARRMIAIAESPGLTVFDELELSSQNRLSRGRLNLGARSLPALALVTAATAAALAADADPAVQRLSAEATENMINQAAQLLHDPDQEAHGATVLALMPKFEPSLGRYADALIVHPSADVRTVAASMVVLDEQAQRILAADSSPQVRAALAGRPRELAEDVLSALQADEHADVQRALASS